MKKKFTILTISIVLLICATFIIYKSDTKNTYTKPKEFVEEGNTLAWTVGGVKQTGAFPTKDSSYVFDSLTCQDGVTADWDSTNWGLININSNGQNKIKCTINFIRGYGNKKCIRATTLHTEECEQTSTTSYCSGAGYTSTGSKGTTTITYGNLGASGTLAAGDAFDCDINGNKRIDNNERFYYVSPKTNGATTDANIAVLIYYNDYDSTPVKYESSAKVYTNGPITAIDYLPTTTQWPNISLTSTVRNITDETGTVRKTGFDYGNKAARLATYQEIVNACYNGTEPTQVATGDFDANCLFLIENTKFSTENNPQQGIWLETARSSSDRHAYFVSAINRISSRQLASTSGTHTARPAIEVAKSDIEY